MTGQQLKNSILQMAVQGKLVPQDPNDEPASVLLERIRAEKEQLIKEGKLKKEKNPSVIFRGADNLPYEKIGKNEPVCIADEVPFEIPESWEWVRIRSLGEIVRGSGIKRNETVRQGLPCVRYGELYTTYQTSFTTTVSFIAPDLYEKCKHFSYGDVLMTLTGENKPDIAKAVAYLGTESIAAGGDLAFWTQHGMNPLFLSYTMASPYIIGRKVALATGDIIVHISGDKLGTILLPVPPLAEQERIVARILEAEQVIKNYALKATTLQKLQDSFPEALKKSILQEAVQGKLVPQDPSDEPASDLLERIRTEKERLIQESKIKRDKHESIIYRRDNSHYEKHGSEIICIDNFLPFELPNNWQWERLINLYNFIDYRGSTPTKIESGIPLITAKNVKKGYIEYKIRDYISKEEYGARQSRGISQKGDILFTTEAPLGNVALADLDQFSAGQRLITLQQYTKHPFIDNALVVYFMLSDCFQNQLIEQSTGTTVKGIKADKLKQLLIPVPPRQEQVRILEQLRKILKLCVAL